MKNSDQPIYPIPKDRDINASGKNGLTKREYFAAMAMQGMLSNGMPNDVGVEPPYHMSCAKLARYAIEYADELLKQLEQ